MIMRGAGALLMVTLATPERTLCPFELTAMTTYSVVPFSAAASVKLGRVNPETTT